MDPNIFTPEEVQYAEVITLGSNIVQRIQVTPHNREIILDKNGLELLLGLIIKATGRKKITIPALALTSADYFSGVTVFINTNGDIEISYTNDKYSDAKGSTT